MRVCGAEVEWTLQKGGGGFEFAIKSHSLSFTFSILFSIKIHHFHQALPFCHFRPCGWSIRARLTTKMRLVTVRPSLSSCDIARGGLGKRGRLRYVNPTLCPTFCQLFASCSCAPVLRIHKTRRSLATDHDLLAIHMPHTRFIHTSRLHIATSAAHSKRKPLSMVHYLLCP